jgi:4a-hydroxytetrahydrobiopterin dehydratase
MSDLAKKRCIPCEKKTAPLLPQEVAKLEAQVAGWIVADDARSIYKEFVFDDFDQNMMFVNQIAELAETEGHHPDLNISYNKLRVTLTTHAINGLSENDFILASKIDELEG